MKKFSSITCLSLVLSVLTFAFISCSDDDDDNKSNFKFNPDKVEVEIGKTAEVSVSGGTVPYTVASSDSKIATVSIDSSKIKITGVKVGKATILVTDKEKKTGSIAVTVVKNLDFDKKTVSLTTGKEDVVTVKNGTAPYTVQVKDSKIATATVKDDKVTIKAVKAGTTTVTVIDKDKTNGVITVTIK